MFAVNKIIAAFIFYVILCPVSYFSLQLRDAAKSTDINQVMLSHATGISASSMSKYFRDAAPIGPEVASKLIRAFPAPHNSLLLAAYLRDETPPDLRPLVTVLANARAAEDPADPIPGMDQLSGEARNLIAYFAQRISDPVIYDMLEATRRALES